MTGIYKRKSYNKNKYIVVIALSLILMFISSPKVMAHKQQAKFSQIINDIKAVEYAILINNNIEGIEDNRVDIDYIVENIKDRKAYIDEGLLLLEEEIENAENILLKTSSTLLDPETFHKINKNDFIKPMVNTKLKGDFFINEDGEVLYIDHTIQRDKLVIETGSKEVLALEYIDKKTK